MHMQSSPPPTKTLHEKVQPIAGPSSVPSTTLTAVPAPTSPIMRMQSSPPPTILKTLHKKVKNLPKLVPLAKKTGPLAGYCCDSTELTKDILADADIWETWDQTLNVLIPHSIPDIYPLVTRGKYGLIALVQVLEHLIRDRKVDESLLDGKVGRLIEAIDRHLFSFPVFTRLFTILIFSVSASKIPLPLEKPQKEGGDRGFLPTSFPLSKSPKLVTGAELI